MMEHNIIFVKDEKLLDKINQIRSFLRYIKRHVNHLSIIFFLQSLRSFIEEFFIASHPFKIFKKRKNGISVLLPTQNEEMIVKLSVKSLLDFANEIIIVDNGSTDKTKEIVIELAKKYSKIKFFDKPGIQDLYQNRQFALRQSNYRWICRFDSDFVAYIKGKNNILKLRNFVLKLPKGIIPKIISLYYLNLGIDFWHIRLYDFSMKNKLKVIEGFRFSIYEYFPFFTFFRFRNRECGSYQIFMRNYVIKSVYFFHCIIKSKLDFFLRTERSNWRGTNNFKKYPTLISYMKDIIRDKYNTDNINEALQIFSEKVLYNKSYYKKYDPTKYLPYPSLIENEMKKEDVFRVDKYFNK